MVGVIVTLVVIAAVAYCVLKNYYPPIILLLAGIVMLAGCAGTPSNTGEKSAVIEITNQAKTGSVINPEDVTVSETLHSLEGKRYYNTQVLPSTGDVNVLVIPILIPGYTDFENRTFPKGTTDEEKQQGFVKVYPGLGGMGGQTNGAEGEDGMFSRFGNRIIADGGMGGDTRATNPADSDKQAGLTTYQINGKDGIPSALPSDIKEKIKYPDGVTVLEQIRGGLSHNTSCNVNGKTGESAHGKYDAQGQGSCLPGYYLIPGSGGAGGGAQGSEKFDMNQVKWGLGGRGGSGIVIVTW